MQIETVIQKAIDSGRPTTKVRDLEIRLAKEKQSLIQMETERGWRMDLMISKLMPTD